MKNISRLLSLVLRHKPEVIGITLDKNGWVSIDELIEKLKLRKDTSVTFEHLQEIIDTNDKQRFAFNSDKTMIRASQGHSVKVDLKLSNEKPPINLFHGTVEKSLESIFKTGLTKMKRHAVHLSEDLKTADVVGSRRGKSIILTIKSGLMFFDGYKFQKSENGVWLTDIVPSKYISL